MAKFPTMEEFAKQAAELALDEFQYEGKTIREWIKFILSADVVEVVRCENCIYYHKAHVRCDDGTEKDFSEPPPEAFGTLGFGVTGEYGINDGGKCETDKNNGYAEDKSVFREPTDFCSRRRHNNGC